MISQLTRISGDTPVTTHFRWVQTSPGSAEGIQCWNFKTYSCKQYRNVSSRLIYNLATDTRLSVAEAKISDVFQMRRMRSLRLQFLTEARRADELVLTLNIDNILAHMTSLAPWVIIREKSNSFQNLTLILWGLWVSFVRNFRI